MTSLLGRRNIELSPEQVAEKRIRHVYYGMISRCTKSSNAKYPSYGGRGIRVCDRWLGRDGFVNFTADMGERTEGVSLDRRNNDGDYCPENCHWASRSQQARNKRTSRYLTHNGQRMTIADWAEVSGINYRLLQYRISKGWDIDRALTQPVNKKLSRDR
jgi:hypothetical protein